MKARAAIFPVLAGIFAVGSVVPALSQGHVTNPETVLIVNPLPTSLAFLIGSTVTELGPNSSLTHRCRDGLDVAIKTDQAVWKGTLVCGNAYSFVFNPEKKQYEITSYSFRPN